MLSAGMSATSNTTAASDICPAQVQKRLRELTSQSQPLLVKEDSTTYPLKPIGILESCFRQRNGTPRQPLLVPAAKARLKLRCSSLLLGILFLHELYAGTVQLSLHGQEFHLSRPLRLVDATIAGLAYLLPVLRGWRVIATAGLSIFFIAIQICRICGAQMIGASKPRCKSPS